MKNKDEAPKTAEELANIAKNARDPAVKKAAQEALEQSSQANGNQNKQGPDQTAKKKTTGEEDKADGPPKKGGNNQSKVETKTPDNGPQQKADGSGNEAGKNGKQPKEEGTEPGKIGTGPNGTGLEDDITKSAADAKLAGRGGDLQLDDLKKRMTPETLKKLGWTAEDWQQFLKDAQAYQAQQRLPGQARNNPDKRGVPAIIPGARLRPIDTNPNAVLDSLQIDRALPPPEFREAQRQFTAPNAPEKK